MTEKTDPTMMAAKLISENFSLLNQSNIADIIRQAYAQREMHLAELLEVAKQTLGWLKATHNWEPINLASGRVVVDALDQAIAKAEAERHE